MQIRHLAPFAILPRLPLHVGPCVFYILKLFFMHKIMFIVQRIDLDFRNMRYEKEFDIIIIKNA